MLNAKHITTGIVLVSLCSSASMAEPPEVRGGNPGEVAEIIVVDGGIGYLNFEAWDLLFDNTGTGGSGASAQYEVDGTIGAYLDTYIAIDTNENGNGMYGTGYVADNGGGQMDYWVSGLEFTNDAGDAGPVCAHTDPSAGRASTWVAGYFDSGIWVFDYCTVAVGGSGQGDICDIDINNHGIGYVPSSVGLTMDFYVNGVLSTDYMGTYDTNAYGEIMNIYMWSNDAPAEGYPTNYDQVTLMPRDAAGTGFEAEVYLWGEFDGFTNWYDGVNCTQVALQSSALEDVLKNNCTDCSIQNYAALATGVGASITAGPIPSGIVVGAGVGEYGFDYQSPPTVMIDPASITAGSGAIFEVRLYGQQACCIDATMTCVNLSADDCLAAGGQWHQFETCSTYNCYQVGACCLPDGSCVDLVEPDLCDAGGGVFQGDGVSCMDVFCPGPPSGACCLHDGTCMDKISPELCKAGKGSYQGDDSLCSEVDCPFPSGWCCLPSGDCFDTGQLSCKAFSGTWGGAGTACSDGNACSEPCLADIDGDGSVTVSDLLQVIGAWGACP